MWNVSQFEDLSSDLCQDQVNCFFYYIVAPIGYLLLGIFMCLGNLLTIAAVMKTEHLRTHQNLHIISLAVADLFTGLTCVFGVMLMHFRPVAFHVLASREFCVYFLMSYLTTSAASNSSITLIAVDRYLYIVYPLKYVLWVTEARTKLVIVLFWTLSLGIGLGTLYYDNLDESPSCFLFGALDIYYQLASNTIPFLAVCVLAAMFYTKIIRTAYQQQRRVEIGTDRNIGTRSKYKLKNIRLLVTVCGIYIMCWLPFHLTFVNFMVTGTVTSNMSFLVLLGLVNSGVNFVVYPCMNSDFRKAFLNILCACKKTKETVNNM